MEARPAGLRRGLQNGPPVGCANWQAGSPSSSSSSILRCHLGACSSLCAIVNHCNQLNESLANLEPLETNRQRSSNSRPEPTDPHLLLADVIANVSSRLQQVPACRCESTPAAIKQPTSQILAKLTQLNLADTSLSAGRSYSFKTSQQQHQLVGLLLLLVAIPTVAAKLRMNKTSELVLLTLAKLELSGMALNIRL